MNETETLYNTGSLSSPICGATFTWTFGTDLHIVTVSSIDRVAATATDIQGQASVTSIK